VLAGIAHVLGRSIKLSSLNYRSAKPGMGLQKLHVDCTKRCSRALHGMQLYLAADDFSEKNGATRIVPGTHLSGSLPQDILPNPEESHPDEVIIDAPAGSVLFLILMPGMEEQTTRQAKTEDRFTVISADLISLNKSTNPATSKRKL
jgi:ectoine hydroxylase-related dioxygenase (phytanoyl-CoA dioxygenase family)